MDWNSVVLKRIFPSVIVRTNSQKLHLTFDDGPHPVSTPIVLDILKKYNLYATFFLLGKNVFDYPDLAKQIKLNGHQIGNHSYSHNNLLFESSNSVSDEIQQAEDIIISTVNERTRYFRPPYGYFDWTTLRVLEENKMKCVLWSDDSKDYKMKPHNIYNRVLNGATQGSIILFHDNDNTSNIIYDYLPATIEALITKGYSFDTL
jgi:peptidoglycan-N-acetylglucosamine deacetylase